MEAQKSLNKSNNPEDCFKTEAILGISQISLLSHSNKNTMGLA